MKRVRISELKSHLSEYLRAAEAGETLEVVDRARPIVRVVPIPGDGAEVDLVAAERPFPSVRNVRLPPLEAAVSSLGALRAERGER
jgi:prevent-host-death family protein